MPTPNGGESKWQSSRMGIVVFSVLAVVVLALGAAVWSIRKTGLDSANRASATGGPAGGGSASGASAGGGSARGISPVKGTLHLETFVLNLADPGQRSYLRVGIDLGLGGEVGKGEDAPAVGPVRDTIVGVLAESRVNELLTAKGKTQLKGDLLRARAVASPVRLCSTPARYRLKRLLEPFLPKLVVLSPLEVPPVIEVQSLGVLH